MVNDNKLAERDGTSANEALVHRDGHRVRILGRETDEAGRLLQIGPGATPDSLARWGQIL